MTPSYIFDIDIFHKRIREISESFPGLKLVYSIKANPFLLPYLPEEITHIEVCSPGELSICRELKIALEKIIYSGLVKEEADIREALSYGVDMITAESLKHYSLIKEAVRQEGGRVRLLPRLTSGNQFGMVKEDVLRIIEDSEGFDRIDICGIHYYSGTAKKTKQIEADIGYLRAVLSELENSCGFNCGMIEYGPGLSAEYFAGSDSACEEKDMELLSEAAPLIMEFSKSCSLSLEFGRFMAAPCGTYETRVMDMKSAGGIDYVIIDGGTHQIRYYGPNAAMKTPPVEQDGDGDEREYMICGSLCTTADVLVRNITLHEVRTDDILRFKRTGAYSVTEGPMLFLSRRMPEIYIRSESEGLKLIRSAEEAYRINLPD
ncbi:MAG: alanine racemase [Lachnospiraceae bacterium]|nr:alanine racemase [Lachnospiraceae bacterium]